jgi:hypothetical protein
MESVAFMYIRLDRNDPTTIDSKIFSTMPGKNINGGERRPIHKSPNNNFASGKKRRKEKKKNREVSLIEY